jgi:hypothetical protein
MANNVRQINKARESFVDGLKALLAQAESGELEGIALVAFTASDPDPDLMVGGAFGKLEMIGAIEELKMLLHLSED